MTKRTGRPSGIRLDHTPRATREEQLRELVAQGFSKRQIAAHLGISTGHTGNLAHRLGIDMPVKHQHLPKARRIVEQTVTALDALATGLGLVKNHNIDLTPEEAMELRNELKRSLVAFYQLSRWLGTIEKRSYERVTSTEES